MRRPSATTPTRSARSAVESRWAITTTVRPPINTSIAALDQYLCARVEARGGFVEHEQRGVGECGTGQRHELLLAGGQPRSPLANLGVEPFGQRGEPFAGSDGLEGRFHVCVGRIRAPDANVVPDGPGEQETLLRNDRDPLAE